MIRKLIFILLLIVFLLSCSSDVTPVIPTIKCESVYSWNREIIEDPYVALDLCKKYGFEFFYQGLYPRDFRKSALSELVSTVRSSNAEIYYLIGDASWTDASHVINNSLKPLVRYNKKNPSSQITGVCIDIEFFRNKKTTEQKFSDLICQLCSYCHENGISVVLCLPFWIVKNLPEYLFSCIDSLSVTVFSPGNEIEILNDMPFLPDEIVLELQRPSERYGVLPSNTYYSRDPQDLCNTITLIKNTYPDIRISLHHLSYVC